MSTIGKRIKQFALKKCATVRDFEVTCGFSAGIVARESNIRVDNLAKILQTYPDMDVLWILTGTNTGMPVSSPESAQISDKTTENEEYFLTIIKSQQALIKAQQDTINTMMSMKGI